MNQRLLVVDDDPITAKFLTRCGDTAKASTMAVLDGASFRRMLDSFLPTTVVIDILIPDEDGIMLLRHLASQRRRMPIILISAYSHSYLPAARRLGEAYGLDIVDSLAKPINPLEFEAALHRADSLANKRIRTSPDSALGPRAPFGPLS